MLTVNVTESRGRHVVRAWVASGVGGITASMKPSFNPSRRSADTAPTRLAVLEALVETSDDAIFSHDERGLVTSWNQSAARIFGLGEIEVLGRRGASLFPEHLRRAVEVVLDMIAAGDRVHQFETEIRRKDGLPVPIALSGAPVRDADGTIIGAVLIARDITEQRIAQATLAEIDARSRAGEAEAHVGRVALGRRQRCRPVDRRAASHPRRRPARLRRHPRRPHRARPSR